MTLEKLSNTHLAPVASGKELCHPLSQKPVTGSLSDAQEMQGVKELNKLLRTLDPHQKPGVWVYAEIPRGSPLPAGTESMVVEEESCTVVLAEADAEAAGLKPLYRAAWITLKVHSALDAVGLVAEVSCRLAGHGISCNVLAGARHDHILVPFDLASEALVALLDLQNGR